MPCPRCKVPGDDCVPIQGQCLHHFHLHCILKWTEEGSSEDCPLCRKKWVVKNWYEMIYSLFITSIQSKPFEIWRFRFLGVLLFFFSLEVSEGTFYWLVVAYHSSGQDLMNVFDCQGAVHLLFVLAFGERVMMIVGGFCFFPHVSEEILKILNHGIDLSLGVPGNLADGVKLFFSLVSVEG